MRSVLLGASLVVVLATAALWGGYASSGRASNGRAHVSLGTTGDDGPTIHIVSGTPHVGSSASSNALPGARGVAKLFRSIRQRGFVLGRAQAPVTLVEYIDLQCPICGAFATQELPTLVRKYVRHGKLKIKLQPWSFLDPYVGSNDSTRGQRATIAAAAQSKAFNFSEILFDHQGNEGTGWLNDRMVSKIAASVTGLKPYRLGKTANGPATQKIVKSIDHWARTHYKEVIGTPTIYLVKGKGAPKYFGTGLPKLGKLEAAINALVE